MASEPSKEGIETLVALTPLPAAEAAWWLKAYGCDTQKTLNAYFDNNGILPSSHSEAERNEQLFQPDSIGQRDQRPFTVHRSDALARDPPEDNAPSRPPSRVGMQDTNRLVDNQNGHQSRLTLAEQAQQDVDTAMSQSLNGASASGGQETGIIHGTTPRFGPATRNHYEAQDWTLTVPRTSAQEILQKPDAVDRKRPLDAPAFLRSSLAESRLPPLVSILHTIPMAREALLSLNDILPDYDLDPEWWDGVPANKGMLRAVDPVQEHDESLSGEIIYEFQRLMAFLDDTKRAYGSSDVLSRVHSKDEWENGSSENNLADVLDGWFRAALGSNPENPYLNVFKSEALKVYLAGEDVGSESESKSFSCLDLPVPAPSDLTAHAPRTLYDVIDFALWSGIQDHTSEFAFLHLVGEVICMQITASNQAEASGLGIKVPPVLFLDRYIESSKLRVQEMLKVQQSLQQEIKRIEQKRARITTIRPSGCDSAYNLSTLISKAVDYYLNEKGCLGVAKGSNQDSNFDTNEKILSQLRLLAVHVDEKLKRLGNSRQVALDAYVKASSWYTKSSDNPGEPPYHGYTLRGVASAKHSAYVLDRLRSSDCGVPVKHQGEEWQWWKLSYDPEQTQPVSQTKVREIEVLKAARDESTSALLVYASQKAMSLEPSKLPSQLQNFVAADNLNFASELDSSGKSNPLLQSNSKVDDFDADVFSTKDHRRPSLDNVDSGDLVAEQPPGHLPPLQKSSSRSPPHSERATDVARKNLN